MIGEMVCCWFCAESIATKYASRWQGHPDSFPVLICKSCCDKKKEEIYRYDLNHIPIGSHVMILWKSGGDDTYRISQERSKGRCLVNEYRGYNNCLATVASFIDRVWLLKHEGQ